MVDKYFTLLAGIRDADYRCQLGIWNYRTFFCTL